MGYGVVLSAGSRGAADPTHVRAHNLALVLREIHAHQPLTRTELASRTGLARASLTTLVPELASYGLVRETDSRPRNGAGRPGTDLWIDGAELVVLVVQLTDEGIVGETVNLSELSLRSTHVHAPPSKGDPAPTLDLLSETLLDHLGWIASEGLLCLQIVVVVPAPLIGDPPVIMASYDLGWEQVDVIGELRRRLPDIQIELTLANDANMAGIAESWAIAGPDARPLTAVYLKSDIGVGGAVISAGTLFVGGKGVGFEPGHVCVRPDGVECNCGRRGCLVAEAGPVAVIDRAGISIPADGTVRDALAEVLRRADAGDAAAMGSLVRLGDDLRRFILDVQLLFDPDIVIMGGFWADAFDRLGLDSPGEMRVPPPLQEARDAALGGRFVVAGSLGPDAARRGAMRFALEALFDDPAAIGAKRLASLDAR